MPVSVIKIPERSKGRMDHGIQKLGNKRMGGTSLCVSLLLRHYLRGVDRAHIYGNEEVQFLDIRVVSRG